jgi:hypothetical protein
MAPRKRGIDEIRGLREPVLGAAALAEFAAGVALFNAGRYWHAHEEWEKVWLTMPDDESGDAEIVLRGLIQLAAALHLLGLGRLDGAASNFGKALAKLAIAPPRFMGVAIVPLIEFIQRQQQCLDRDAPCAIELEAR